MKLVQHMGQIFRMSDRSYARMLRAMANGQDAPTWGELKATCMGEVACDTTDMDREEARCYYLELMR